MRRRLIGDAAEGVPAHLTLLYPFVEPARLDGAVRRRLARVADAHEPWAYDLARAATFPDTVYAAVERESPFVTLQADLERAFPGFPIYGPDRPFDYVPHVSVLEGPAASDPSRLRHPAWAALPVARRAAGIEVIVRDPGGRWGTRWRIPLGRPAGSGRR